MAAFSARTGGVSAAPYDSLNLSEGVGDDPAAVRTNRSRLLTTLGLDPAGVAFATQVHGATCLTPVVSGWAGTGDALATRDAGPVLVVGTADCLAVLLWDATRPAIAAAHAGWRGTLAGVVPRTVETLVELGSQPANLRAALGPRIGPCCFEVGPEVAEQFVPEDRSARAGRATIDLARAVIRQLRAAGLPEAGVFDVANSPGASACTACDAARYFSHRRDQGQTGRAWGVISTRPAAPKPPAEAAV